MFERCCVDREFAEDTGAFAYIATYDAWCFVDGPRRTMTFKASWLLTERGGESHDGEPFRWHSCPWCGADLPTPDDETGG